MPRLASELASHSSQQRLLTRISHTLAAHLANHLAASGFVLPHHITLDMPWSSSTLATKALRNLNHPSVRQAD